MQPRPMPAPWAEPVEAWMAWMTVSGLSQLTIGNRRWIIHCVATRFRGRGPVELTTADLVAYLAARPWSPETLRNHRGALRSFYAFMADRGDLAVSPAARLPKVGVRRGVPRPAPRDVVAAARAKATPRELLMVDLALLAGLRCAEIARVQRSHVEGDMLRVLGKGGKVRMVPVHPQLRNALADYQDESRFRHAYAENPASRRYLFPGFLAAGHIAPGSVSKLLGRLLGPGWSAHKLRHRFATDAYGVERDLLAVQALLGHSRPETTAVYAQVDRQSLIRAVGGVHV
jgi:integrase